MGVNDVTMRSQFLLAGVERSCAAKIQNVSLLPPLFRRRGLAISLLDYLAKLIAVSQLSSSLLAKVYPPRDQQSHIPFPARLFRPPPFPPDPRISDFPGRPGPIYSEKCAPSHFRSRDNGPCFFLRLPLVMISVEVYPMMNIVVNG